MASVGGPRPACGVHPFGVVVRGPAVWCPAVWCPAVRCPAVRCPAVRCPVTWGRRPGPAVRPAAVHPSSVQPSGVHPSSVQPSGVHPSGVQPAGVHPRPDASVSSHLRRWRWGPDRCGGHPSPREWVEVPGGLPCRPAARSTAEAAWTRATLPRSRVGQWGRWRPGRVRAAAARARGATRQARPACGAPVAGGAGAREQAAARGGCTCRVAAVPSWAGCATTVRGRRRG